MGKTGFEENISGEKKSENFRRVGIESKRMLKNFADGNFFNLTKKNNFEKRVEAPMKKNQMLMTSSTIEKQTNLFLKYCLRRP